MSISRRQHDNIKGVYLTVVETIERQKLFLNKNGRLQIL